MLAIGKIEEARIKYEKALEINNQHADALNGLGNTILLDKAKVSDKSSLIYASQLFKKAYEIDPTFDGFIINYKKTIDKIAKLNKIF